MAIIDDASQSSIGVSVRVPLTQAYLHILREKKLRKPRILTYARFPIYAYSLNGYQLANRSTNLWEEENQYINFLLYSLFQDANCIPNELQEVMTLK